MTALCRVSISQAGWGDPTYDVFIRVGERCRAEIDHNRARRVALDERGGSSCHRRRGLKERRLEPPVDVRRLALDRGLRQL